MSKDQCSAVTAKILGKAGTVGDALGIALVCEDGGKDCAVGGFQLGAKYALGHFVSKVASPVAGEIFTVGPPLLEMAGNAWNGVMESTPDLRLPLDGKKHYDSYYPEGVYACGSTHTESMDAAGNPSC